MTNKLTAWTISHFAVDMSCFYILFKGINAFYSIESCSVGAAAFGAVQTAQASPADYLGYAFLLYNIIAFGFQPIIGALVDRFPKLEKIVGIEGTELMLIPLIMINISNSEMMSWASMIIAAFLNACFHVGGGVQVMKSSGGKISPSGIFVSSGALGVATGTMLGNMGGKTAVIMPLFTILLSIFLLFKSSDNWAKDYLDYLLRGKKGEKIALPNYDYVHFDITKNTVQNDILRADGNRCGIRTFDLIAAKGGVAFIVCALFAAVVIRSYSGMIWPLGFEKTGMLIILVPFSSAVGKAMGGILSDKIGVWNTAVYSLVSSAAFFAFSFMAGKMINGASPVVWILMGISIAFFNVAMPITLTGLASAMPENLGFGFGLSTLALLIGTVWASQVSKTGFENNMEILVLALILIALLMISVTVRKDR